MMLMASAGTWAVTSWRVQSRVPVTGAKWFSGSCQGSREGRPPSLAGDAEHQPGAVGDVGGAQVAAEGDGAAAVGVGFDLLAEDGESGGFGHGRGQDRPPVFGGAGIVLAVEPGHLAQEGAIELPSVQAVGERQVARLEPGVLGRPGGCLLAAAEGLSGSGPVTGSASRSITGSSTASGAPVMTARARPSARRVVTCRVPPGTAMSDPCGGHRRAQVGDGHGGHGDPGRVQQLAGHLPGVASAGFRAG